MTKRHARCCCGGLRVEVQGEPSVNVLCHCMDCRRRTGSAFGWSAYFAEDQVSRSGKPNVYQPQAAVAGERWFCPTCGSTMGWRDNRLPGRIGVPGGALEPPIGPPAMSSQDENKCAWLTLPESCAAIGRRGR